MIDVHADARQVQHGGFDAVRAGGGEMREEAVVPEAQRHRVGRRQQHFACQVRTLLRFAPVNEGEEAGLTILMNNSHHYEIALFCREGKRQIIVRRRIGDLSAIVAQEDIEADLVELSVQARPDLYTFSYALPGQPVRQLATGLTRYLSTEVAGGFTGDEDGSR